MHIEEYLFSPSELDYKAKKCKRCFYIWKKYKMSPGDRPPPVFSSFDAAQKPYYKNINTKEWSINLPEGVFMNSDELPSKITSEGLLDNKNRKFKINGIPDIVIKFKEKGYGIIDFKTTSISIDKAENYRYQLEAYAQIFANPGSTKKAPTPKLKPITHMGILQFYPSKITEHTKEDCNMKMKISYSPLRRDEKGFYNYITNLIDLLENPAIPIFSDDCNFCRFTKANNNLNFDW